MSTAVLFAAPGSSSSQLHYLTDMGDAVKAAKPGTAVHWTFTSEPIRKALANDGTTIPAPRDAVEEIMKSGHRRLVVMPLHMGRGQEYELAIGPAIEKRKHFDEVIIGKPLFETEPRFDRILASILAKHSASLGEDQALLLVAHGSDRADAAPWQREAAKKCEAVDPRLIVTFMHGTPTAADALLACRKRSLHRARLTPLMLLKGPTVERLGNMDAKGTPGCLLTANGIDCSIDTGGLLDDSTIADVWISEVLEAVES